MSPVIDPDLSGLPPASPAQVPGGAEPLRDLDPLERLGHEREKRRRRVGWVVLLFLVPGLAFPLLARRSHGRPSSDDKPSCAALLDQCVARCLPERERAAGAAVSRPALVCIDGCMPAACR